MTKVLMIFSFVIRSEEGSFSVLKWSIFCVCHVAHLCVCPEIAHFSVCLVIVRLGVCPVVHFCACHNVGEFIHDGLVRPTAGV